MTSNETTRTETAPWPSLTDCKGSNETGWQTRHHDAVTGRRGSGMEPSRKLAETAIVMGLSAWQIYGAASEANGWVIADDGVLGPYWLDLGKSLSGLLDGETGRLDCGTCSRFIHETLIRGGFPDGIDSF